MSKIVAFGISGIVFGLLLIFLGLYCEGGVEAR